MNPIKKGVNKLIRAVCSLVTNGLSQEANKPKGEKVVDPAYNALLRGAAAEGVVLLKNEEVLPFSPETPVAVFGRCQCNWFYVGYGSGGDVNPPYEISLQEAMRGRMNAYAPLLRRYDEWCHAKANVPDEGWWGHWPMHYDEMPLQQEWIDDAAEACSVALVVLGRAAGEDRENTLKPGSYYLTKQERQLLDAVTGAFAKTVVVLDCGNIIDLSWVEEYGERIAGLLYAFLGGQESCPALVDVLTGTVNPCGKLPDTIARHYMEYPSADSFGARKFSEYREDIYVGYRYFETFNPHAVLYPFGFGLSYTQFSLDCTHFCRENGKVEVEVLVKNVGAGAGKEVVQLYLAPPQGKLGKPLRQLVAFAKTPILAPGESHTVRLRVYDYDMASFDDSGASGHIDCYVLEQGEYGLWLGTSVRDVHLVGQFEEEETRCILPVSDISAPAQTFLRMRPIEQLGRLTIGWEKVEQRPSLTKHRIEAHMPKAVGYQKDKAYHFDQLRRGEISMQDFLSCLTDEECEALTRGHGFMNSPLGPEGNGGAMGGIIPSLQQKGVPAVITVDGPAGLRLKRYCSLLPSGTCLAATFNEALTRQVYEGVADELIRHGAHVLLGPGMNIHRNVLCGRNFEYFAEDPLLTGRMAAAVVMGLQGKGVGACVKHYACNNQETNRNRHDSRLSVRALREIYLRGFEYCVRVAKPWSLMTSYNLINGVWGHYNYDLATTVLRDEWGFDGVSMTDWWMQHDRSHEYPNIRDNGYRVRAGVDVYMPGSFSRAAREYRSDGTLLETVGKPDGITRGELERSAERVLRLALTVTKSKE
ncbi:MAG: glycoside hydrolase family 3 protein [Clostridia bacterium]|nr:glycoside hydrolase family 3 protein [Clostridia bacterium]